MRRFCLDFANISPHIAAELLQGNDAQTDRFLAAYDAAGEVIDVEGQIGAAAFFAYSVVG